MICHNMVYSVGNGRRVRFWKDKWCGDDLLCIYFPFLFAISLAKEAWVENVEDLTLEFGCKVSTLPSSYFGFPLGALFQEVAVWDGVEEMMRKRLFFWKMQYISKGGKLTLI